MWCLQYKLKVSDFVIFKEIILNFKKHCVHQKEYAFERAINLLYDHRDRICGEITEPHLVWLSNELWLGKGLFGPRLSTHIPLWKQAL